MTSKIDKSVLHSLTYGLYIISSRHKNKINGQIVNTVMQVTSDPVRISIIINKKKLYT